MRKCYVECFKSFRIMDLAINFVVCFVVVVVILVLNSR